MRLTAPQTYASALGLVVCVSVAACDQPSGPTLDPHVAKSAINTQATSLSTNRTQDDDLRDTARSRRRRSDRP